MKRSFEVEIKPRKKQKVEILDFAQALLQKDLKDVSIKDICDFFKNNAIEKENDQEFIAMAKYCYSKGGEYFEFFAQLNNRRDLLIGPELHDLLGKSFLYSLVPWALDKDLKQAQDLFEISLSMGSIKAYKNLAKVFRDLEKFDTAFEFLEKGISAGDASAVNMMGVMLENGQHCEQDFAKARKCFEDAYDMGSKEAIYNLGRVYHHAIACERDYSKAFEYYQEGIKRNSHSCYNNLAVMYYEGNGVEKDYTKAMELYLKASAKGDGRANYNIALMYKNGRGVKVDPVKEVEYYEKSIKSGNALAYNNLGLIYKTGTLGKIDNTKALECFQLGAAKGNYSSLHNLASMFEDGLGVSQDLEMAREMYERCIVENDFLPSICNLGDMYFYGDFGKDLRGYVAAEKLYCKALALKSNDEHVKGNLGLIFMKGLAGSKDLERGVALCEEAISLGCQDDVIQHELGVHYFYLEKYRAAMHMFDRAAELGNAESIESIKYLEDNKFAVSSAQIESVERVDEDSADEY